MWFYLKAIRLFVAAEGFANNKTDTPAEIIVLKERHFLNHKPKNRSGGGNIAGFFRKRAGEDYYH